tara:strand:+ start:608 stop:1363 length:756 start_codon:yes stop_codon:yes gene_type:complete
MKWWRKRDDDIILDCYTYNPYAYNFAKINYGRHYIPDWWKNTPKVIGERPTIKNCPAVVEYYLKGIVLPMWCEVEIIINPKGSEDLYVWKSAQKQFEIGQHNQLQFEAFTKDDGYNLKIISPWYIKCRENIHFTFTQPIWSQRDTMFDLILTPGLVSFKSQMNSNLNYFFQQKDTQQIINIQPLTPMAIMHPISDRKVKLKHHLLTSKEEGFATLGSHNNGLLLARFPKTHAKHKKQLFEKIDKIEKGEYK